MAVGGMGWGKLFRDYTLGANVTGSPTNGRAVAQVKRFYKGGCVVR